ncbi:MAG: hypothetical protein JO339_01065, partial [Alphaproteobacteria bacterium]|nr:hypothetical protein [Alphaproteobacteria bacterium]
GIMTFDGKDYVQHAKGPGHVLDRFNSSLSAHPAIAAGSWPQTRRNPLVGIGGTDTEGSPRHLISDS